MPKPKPITVKSNSSFRELCIQTLLNREVEQPQESNLTTTLGDCRRICSLNLLSHYALFSKTKFAQLEKNWAFRKKSCSASLSQDLVLEFESWVKSRRKDWTFLEKLTRLFGKSFLQLVSTRRFGSARLCFLLMSAPLVFRVMVEAMVIRLSFAQYRVKMQ
ncbi:unannotated protein [freshwater metagenome]|uniref:Unannotated protein n=1 Tax=freshwater metagenome TaxID=449393 RepID=A0A6J6JI45_9ZZZZ